MFGKGDECVVDSINNGKVTNIDKAKALNYLSSASYNYQQEIDK